MYVILSLARLSVFFFFPFMLKMVYIAKNDMASRVGGVGRRSNLGLVEEEEEGEDNVRRQRQRR